MLLCVQAAGNLRLTIAFRMDYAKLVDTTATIAKHPRTGHKRCYNLLACEQLLYYAKVGTDIEGYYDCIFMAGYSIISLLDLTHEAESVQKFSH